MAEKKDTVDKVEDRLTKLYEDQAEEINDAVESSRDDDEKYYEEQREREEVAERQLREYQLAASSQGGVPEGSLVTPREAEEGKDEDGPETASGSDADNVDPADVETTEAIEAQNEADKGEEDENVTAKEVIKQIENSNSTQEVENIAANDGRVSVHRAADKRKEELSKQA